MTDPKLFDFAATLKHETEAALLVNDGAKDHWLPKRFTENNRDGTFTIPEWLAAEKGLDAPGLATRAVPATELRPRMSFADIALCRTAEPHIVALAEIMKIAAPGLKMPHTTLAATIERMLAKRGFEIVPKMRS